MTTTSSTTATQIEPRRRVAATLALLAVTFVWGTTFALVKAALADAPPLLFNLLRMMIAALVLAATHLPALRQAKRSQLRAGAVSGVLLALGYELQTMGLASTTPTRSAFLTGLVVVFVPLLAAVPGLARQRQPLRLSTLAGALIAFAGLLLLTSGTPAHGSLVSGLHVAGWLTLGEWLTLGCAFAFALHLMSLDLAAVSTPPRLLGTLQIGFCALAMLFLLPAGGSVATQLRELHVTPRLVVALLVTSLLATALAFTVQSWAQHHLTPTPTALLLSTEQIFALAVSTAVLGERLSAGGLAGAALIMLAILFIELTPSVGRVVAQKDI